MPAEARRFTIFKQAVLLLRQILAHRNELALRDLVDVDLEAAYANPLFVLLDAAGSLDLLRLRHVYDASRQVANQALVWLVDDVGLAVATSLDLGFGTGLLKVCIDFGVGELVQPLSFDHLVWLVSLLVALVGCPFDIDVIVLHRTNG